MLKITVTFKQKPLMQFLPKVPRKHWENFHETSSRAGLHLNIHCPVFVKYMLYMIPGQAYSPSCSYSLPVKNFPITED